MKRLKKEEEMRKTSDLQAGKAGCTISWAGKAGRNFGMMFSGAKSFLCPKGWEFVIPLFFNIFFQQLKKKVNPWKRKIVQ